MANQSLRLNFNQTVELCYRMAKEVAVLVLGETGIGKSSIAKAMMERYLDGQKYNLIIFDCSARTEADVGLPWLATINGKPVTVYAPSELFGLHLDGPSIVLLDELTKAPKSLFDMLLPVLLERRVSMQYAHPDSFFIATGNLAEEGLGDNIQAHQLDRMMQVTMRKPRLVDENDQPIEWLADYAIPRKLPASAIAFCQRKPEIFADYTPGINNPYINKPGVIEGKFCTPRSFTRLCFNVLPKRQFLDAATFYAACVGMVGEATTEAFFVFLNTEDKLPPLDVVRHDPLNSDLPNAGIEELMMTYKLAYTTTRTVLPADAAYIRRMGGECLPIFNHIVTSSRDTAHLIPDCSRLGLTRDSQAIHTA